MKRKIILSIIGCLSILLITTGCEKNAQILQTEEDVYNYLKEKYPNDIFKIISVKETTLTDDGCSDEVKGNIWTVYSETTQTTFEAYDTYTFNSFTCNYSTNNNYNQQKIN